MSELCAYDNCNDPWGSWYTSMERGVRGRGGGSVREGSVMDALNTLMFMLILTAMITPHNTTNSLILWVTTAQFM